MDLVPLTQRSVCVPPPHPQATISSTTPSSLVHISPFRHFAMSTSAWSLAFIDTRNLHDILVDQQQGSKSPDML